jgi:integrase
MSTKTLRDFYDRKFFPTVQAGLSARRRQPYVSAINRFARFLGREPLLSDLSNQAFSQFWQWLKASHDRKSSYNTRSAIRAIWRLAAERGLVTEKPASQRLGRSAMPLRGECAAAEPGTLPHFFDTLYKPLRLAGRSTKTVALHLIALRHFARFLGRAAVPSDLNDLRVAQFQIWLAGRGVVPVTTNKTVDKLLAQWRFLHRRRLVETYPELRKLPEPDVIPKCWTESETNRLLLACRATTGWIGPVKASDWWTALHIVIYESAERIGAVMQLQWSDIDLATGWLTIRAQVRKGKKRSKLHRLSEAALHQLRAIHHPGRELIFPWPLCNELLYKHYERILARAGLPFDRWSKFHKMRRTVASRFEAAGGDATKLLDHSARKVTLAYLDPRIVRETQASELLPPLEGGAA